MVKVWEIKKMKEFIQIEDNKFNPQKLYVSEIVEDDTEKRYELFKVKSNQRILIAREVSSESLQEWVSKTIKNYSDLRKISKKKDIRMTYTYPAIFSKEKFRYEVNFIDLKGCLTFAPSFLESIQAAKESMGSWLKREVFEKGNVPNPSSFELTEKKIRNKNKQSVMNIEIKVYVQNGEVVFYQKRQKINIDVFKKETKQEEVDYKALKELEKE